MRTLSLHRRKLALAGASTLVLSAMIARADTQAIDVTTVGTYPPLTNNGFNYYQPPGNYTFTWNFTLNSAIQITQLGYYDSALAGTAEPNGFGSHLVTLYDVTTDTTLASTTVTDQNAATGVFKYGAITPVRLNTTDTYEMMGTMTDQYYLVGLNQAAAPLAPQINYDFQPTNIFGQTGPAGTYNDFGPNFQFASASNCTENVAGRDVIALSGDVCTARPGAYNPTTTQVSLPVTYNGFGFYAHGGAITSTGDITIATTNPGDGGGSYGIWADTTDSVVNLNGASSITTAGDNSHGVYASGGGQIVSKGALSVSTSGTGAFGLYASGAGSSINAALGTIVTTGDNAIGAKADAGASMILTGGSISTSGVSAFGVNGSGANSVITGTGIAISTEGNYAVGAQADGGGVVNLTGGSVTTLGASAHALFAAGAGSTLATTNVNLSTGGDYANAGFAANGGAIVLNGGSVQTSGLGASAFAVSGGASIKATGATIITTGAGSGGVDVNGPTSSFTGNSLAIVVKGGADPTGQLHAYGIDNESFGSDAGGGGIVQLTNSTITTGADKSIGIFNADGGSLIMNGGAVTTSGVEAHAIVGLSDSTNNITGVQIITTGNGAHGIDIEGAGTQLTGSNLTVKTSGTASGGVNAEALYNGNGGGSGAGSTGGGTVSLTASSFSTIGDHAFGVATENGGSTTLTQGLVTTSGVQGDAIFGSSGSATTLFNETLTTSGNAAKGIDIEGAGTSLRGSGLTISTSGTTDEATGFHAQGVYNGSSVPASAGETGGGTVTLTDTTVKTAGAFAYGVDTANGGMTYFTGGSIATTGAGAVALLATEGGTAYAGVDGANRAVGISTTGLSTAAVAANTGATITLMGATISTSGDGSSGLTVRDAGTTITANNVTINTQGGTDANTGAHAYGLYNGPGSTGTSGGALNIGLVNVNTSGAGALGLVTDTGGVTKDTGSNFTTTGADAGGVAVLNAGQYQATMTSITTSGDGSAGLLMEGAGGQVSAQHLSIWTKGGVSAATGSHADGVFNGAFGSYASGGTMTISGSSVMTNGFQAYGVSTGAGGKTTFLGGMVQTTGDGAQALRVQGGGALTVGVDNGQPTIVTTSGLFADGAVAFNGGQLSLTGTEISVNGYAGIGLEVNDATSSVTATDVTIRTAGSVIANTSYFVSAVYNGAGTNGTSGGTLTLNNVSVTTPGASTPALLTTAGGVTNVTGGSFVTTGDNSDAIDARGGGVVKITGSTLTTGGSSAFGLMASGVDSQITADRLTISTGGKSFLAGPQAVGVYSGPNAIDASGGTIAISASSVKTTGEQAYGVEAGAGGTVTFTGGSVTTSGSAADGLYATGLGASVSASGVTIVTSNGAAHGAAADSGGTLTLADGVQIATSGSASHGIYVTGAGSAANLAGAVAISVTAQDAAGVYVDSGGAVAGKGALSIQARDFGLYINGAAAAVNPPPTSPALGAVDVPTTIALGGYLSLKTTDASGGAAINLSGNSTSFTGAGGGVIDAAGTAVRFLDGANQSATFVNYQIASRSGDLVYADPSTSAVTFDNSNVQAAGNLAHATGASDLTLTALASNLMGAVVTDPGSVSTMTVSNASLWTLTGSSTVSNLAVNNSFVQFAPTTGGFNTLTVNNYVGANASLTLNAAFSGPNVGADQLVINGGQASGTTTINIRPVGNVGAATTGLGVPVVVTTNGGTIAPGAFTLSGPVVVGGFMYSLQNENGGEYLVSQQGLSGSQASNSLSSLSQSRQTQAITGRILGSILTGATEQMNCSSCSSGFASFGSFAVGAHGRWTIGENISVLAGLSYDSYSGQGVTVNNALLGAAAVRYDMVQLGKYRPFFEAGVAVQPYANVSYRRAYASSIGGASGTGDTLSRSVAVYGRAGYVWRLSRADEAAAYADLTRSWQSTGGYLEGATAGNPFGALVAPTLDTLNIAKVGAQYTHLFGEHIEANVSAGYAFAFGGNYGTSAAIAGFGAAQGEAATSFNWAEWGGRISYRFSRNVIADAFVLGTVGAQPVGDQIHGGLALRMAF